MIASVDNGFVLLSNPKTGTTALEAAFGRFAEIQVGGRPGWKHINYDGMVELFGRYFEKKNCKIYAVVRDPVDTLVSWYKYRSRDELRNPRSPYHKNYTGHLQFVDFFEAWASDDPPAFARVSNPVQWSLRKSGELAPVNFYRYESIDRLVEALSRHVGVRPEVQRLNASPRREVRVDRLAIESAPKMARFMDIYRRIPFVE